MSLNRFVNDFVNSETQYYEYSRKDKKKLRKRIHAQLYEFMNEREKNFHNYIHFLKRKNKKLEEDYDILSNIAVTSIQNANTNEEENTNDDETNDAETNEEEIVYNQEAVREGYKMVAWAFVRMICMIYAALFFVYVYDIIMKESLKWK
jgi:hypothetical protein